MLQKRLDSLNKAIEAIEGGAQSYTLNGRTLTRGSLQSLYSERDKVEMRLAFAGNGGKGFIARASFRGRR
ncbi:MULTISPECIES: hypothetical protein [Desulfovibrionaceae]|uniref:hypothetical protein n=1 Tax=Desulfovibrionaceae TaxID=194924 RepID=UPI001A23956C|nr:MULTISPECIES: hypothetical protein [Desulfovibrionaceae]MBI9110103.1 hypothetical protein [Maridesulfovibrio ferrireducens]